MLLRCVVQSDSFAQELPPASTSEFISGLHVSAKFFELVPVHHG
jgi:hypothetical protein